MKMAYKAETWRWW